jgi:minor extracellular serine protease Vpr
LHPATIAADLQVGGTPLHRIPFPRFMRTRDLSLMFHPSPRAAPNAADRPDTRRNRVMRIRMSALALAASAAVLSLGPVAAQAQGSVPFTAAENGRLWFVELAGKPVADGNSRSAVQAEKAAFRQAAAAAGIGYKERYAYDTLFNGFSIEIAPAQRAALGKIVGVKAMYPVELIQAPTPDQRQQNAADLATALAQTGADIAQNSLGLTGTGIKVGVVDTGVDIDHPAFGGSGSPGTTPFPTARVAFGHDFVGDNYNAGGTGNALIPVPDANPDDCNGHGTHVAGIVGASGGGLTGVAPGVTLGAYRVFGCVGSSSSDVIVAALERAYADGMQVINQSLGAARQWPQYPTAQASSRLVDKGVVMVASIGNNGPGGSSPDAQFAAGAPGVGEKVIGVASYDNTGVFLPYAVVNGRNIPHATMTFSAPAPTAGSGALTYVGRGCNADAYLADPAGKIAMVDRGSCSFAEKAVKAINAGATAVVVANNTAGVVFGTLGAPLGSNVPVVGISQADGSFIKAQAAPVVWSWTDQSASAPNPTGNLISGFSSFGLAADLSLKPNIGAPGGLISSSYPLESGGYATLSGTSMSAPHVAGGVALVLQARPEIKAPQMLAHLQNTADPKVWSLNVPSGLLDHVHRQGAGMMDIVATVQSAVLVEPSQIALGESEAGPKTVRITLKNSGAGAVTYAISHVSAVATGPNSTTGASYAVTGYFLPATGVSFSAPSVTVPAQGSASFDVTIEAAQTFVDRGIYGGYVTLTPEGGGERLRVPYAGLKGDYQSTQILTPTPNGFPWLAQLVSGSYLNRPAGAAYTMAGDDVPFFLVHLDHHARKMDFSVYRAGDGKPVHPVFSKTDVFEYVGRNATPGGFFAFAWDGTRMHDNGKGTPDHRKLVPNGDYVIVMKVLKALGDESNPAHWETWTSPTITLARP